MALQELQIYYININELKVEEGKEKKSSPMKVHFILFLLQLHCPSGDQTSTFSGPVQF